MDDLEEDEDVIIEGSELHCALVNMGYTDFESTTLKKTTYSKEALKSDGKSWNFFKKFRPVFKIYAPKSRNLASIQFATILKAESLLSDHATIVHDFMDDNCQNSWSKIAEYSILAVSSAMLGIAYVMFKRKKTLATIVAASIGAFVTLHKYREFKAVGDLKNVVTAQNGLYRSYKKSLGILRNIYRIGADRKKTLSAFSQLEIDRLKYLQPLTETLLRSMENVCRVYNGASSMIASLLPEDRLESDTLTHFEANELKIEGEITHENLRRLYYVYILVQSDTMQLLATAYDVDIRVEDKRISQSVLRRIIENLSRVLTREHHRMAKVISEYESCKRRTIERKFRLKSTSKWRDLYLNLVLLSRRLQTTYDEIGAILEDIDRREGEEEEASEQETFIAEISAKAHEIYGQIDKSRNFAEFNNLLIAMMRRSRKKVADDSASDTDDDFAKNVESDRPVIRDSEPQIIDEVFEEYITEEYLKPLYDERDEETIESSRFDKLLAKNFMSELKEALVEKAASMSAREAKALMRKYRVVSNAGELEAEFNLEKSIVPCPPPLPSSAPRVPAQRQKPGSRGPVPLPRNIENITGQNPALKLKVPAPPPLPSPEDEACAIERLPIGLPKLDARKIPAFVTFAEEFIGSGDNSEEEEEEKEEEEETSDEDDDDRKIPEQH